MITGNHCNNHKIYKKLSGELSSQEDINALIKLHPINELFELGKSIKEKELYNPDLDETKDESDISLCETIESYSSLERKIEDTNQIIIKDSKAKYFPLPEHRYTNIAEFIPLPTFL